ncbi:MAG: hypothetical protein HY040_09205 [Planctomycetes bacterium]|nr:hypothetical protein [Planctomycetota bacterium]
MTGLASVYGYDKETHYGLTYFLARRVGFTIRQAQQLASADWSVDLDPDTEPVRLPAGVNPLSADKSQLVRARFHALPETADELTYALTHGDLSLTQEKHYRDVVNTRLNQLWQQALSNGNPGVYLHYLQDSFAHNGYLSMTGHTFDWPLTKDPAKSFKFLRASELDYLSNDLTAGYAMASATVQALQNFMVQYGKQSAGVGGGDEGWGQLPCHPEQVASIVTALGQANPVRTLSEPVWERAKEVLEKNLHEDVPEVSEFNFDSQGNLERAPVNKDYRILKARPVELISGKGWHVGEKDGITQVLFTRVLDHRFEPKIDFFGNHPWKDGVYDAAAKEWRLTRKPDLRQIPERVAGSNAEIPEWVRKAVHGKLEWRLTLRAENCKLSATFYPGLIRWKEATKEAWVVQGKEGWGPPSSLEYKWHGAKVP